MFLFSQFFDPEDLPRSQDGAGASEAGASEGQEGRDERGVGGGGKVTNLKFNLLVLST